MDIEQINYTTQALGRLAQQYVGKPKLTARLTALATLTQDLDSCIQAIAARMNVNTAVGIWLDICGWLAGVARVLPNGEVLADEPYRTLVIAKVARNHCKGDVPSMLAQLKRLFDKENVGYDIHVQDLGSMAMHVQIGRILSLDERSILSITSGVSMIPGGILPKPMGVKLSVSERPHFGPGNNEFFCFSGPDDPGTPLLDGGMGFSDPSSPTGMWAGGIL
jgi:hypothetical protein